MTVYRCTNLIISICQGENVYDVGVVEGVDIDLGYNGKLELYYGDETPKHCVGGKIASFSLSRWFYTDEGQENLLLDLFNNKTTFNLRGSLVDNNGVAIPHTSIVVTECRIYKYKPLTGKADDIIGEEASGSGLDWFIDVENTPLPPVLYLPAWNYDNLIGMIWLEGNPAEYDNSHTGEIGVREPSGVDELGESQGGYYDNR